MFSGSPAVFVRNPPPPPPSHKVDKPHAIMSFAVSFVRSVSIPPDICNGITSGPGFPAKIQELTTYSTSYTNSGTIPDNCPDPCGVLADPPSRTLSDSFSKQPPFSRFV